MQRVFMMSEAAWQSVKSAGLSDRATVDLFEAVAGYSNGRGCSLTVLPKNMRAVAALMCHVVDLECGRPQKELMDIMKRHQQTIAGGAERTADSGSAPESHGADLPEAATQDMADAAGMLMPAVSVPGKEALFQLGEAAGGSGVGTPVPDIALLSGGEPAAHKAALTGTPGGSYAPEVAHRAVKAGNPVPGLRWSLAQLRETAQRLAPLLKQKQQAGGPEQAVEGGNDDAPDSQILTRRRGPPP